MEICFSNFQFIELEINIAKEKKNGKLNFLYQFLAEKVMKKQAF